MCMPARDLERACGPGGVARMRVWDDAPAIADLEFLGAPSVLRMKCGFYCYLFFFFTIQSGNHINKATVMSFLKLGSLVSGVKCPVLVVARCKVSGFVNMIVES